MVINREVNMNKKYLYSAKNNAAYLSGLSYSDKPDDLTGISDREYEEFFISLPPKGKQRVFGANGKPKWGVIPSLAPDERLKKACLTIDIAAGIARASFGTNSTFIESEYNRTYQVSVDWINSGFKGSAPKPVKSHAEAYKVPEQQAAGEIKQTGDLWFGTLDEIRDIRLKGKQYIMSLDDDADHIAEAQSFINQLNKIRP